MNVAKGTDKLGTHVHDMATEGPLPEGFLSLGRQGKVRNIYESEDGARICLIATDRMSAFDQISPTPIPGKGAILTAIAREELEVAERHGIATWFDEVLRDNPRAAVGVKAKILPIEMIFRNYMTGSMWREYRDTGDFVGMGLTKGLREWHSFAKPLFTPSTKSKSDTNFHPADVKGAAGIDPDTLAQMERIGRLLFELGTQRAKEKGLILVDAKYEMGVTSTGDIVVADEVHTPDSSRFVMTEEFEESIAKGEQPRHLSKEFLRAVMLDRVYGDVVRAKELMKKPLPHEVVEEMVRRYSELQRIFMGV